jgi:hypothetical protein
MSAAMVSSNSALGRVHLLRVGRELRAAQPRDLRRQHADARFALGNGALVTRDYGRLLRDLRVALGNHLHLIGDQRT